MYYFFTWDIIKNVKMSTPETHYTLFYSAHNANGFMSNWYRAKFELDGRWFTSTEQWYMYKKANYFGDYATAERIMKTDDCRMQKRLGRRVRPFSQNEWMKVAEDIMFRGNKAKFCQNDELLQKLLGTGDTLLAESSGYDKVWGTGYFSDHTYARRQDRWPGKNLLGKVLMNVRRDLRSQQQEQEEGVVGTPVSVAMATHTPTKRE